MQILAPNYARIGVDVKFHPRERRRAIPSPNTHPPRSARMAISTRDHYVTFGRREGDEDFPNSLISGISTFLGARVVPPVREDLVREGVKAGVLGLPWEHTNTCRPGASYGPRSIRRATEHYLSYHGEFQVDLFDALGLADCGDISIVPGNAKRTFERAERCITEIYEAGAFPIILGGDDSCPIPVTSAMSKLIDGKMGYIQMDSHMDTAADVAGETLNHACPVSRTCELPNVDGRNIALVGINGPLNPRVERDYVDRTGIQMITIWDIDEWGIDKTIERILEIAWDGTDGVVLHTDLDVMDQGYTTGVTTPETGGLTPREVIKMIRAFVRQGVEAYVITECSSVYDPANKSARVATRLAMDALGIRANPEGTGRV
jgi:agmatinase